MRSYIIRRLLLTIPTVFIISIIIFFGTRLIPGDVIDAMVLRIVDSGSVSIDIEAAREMLERALGLDVALPVQYGRWMGVLPGADGNFSGILQGNWGKSLWHPSTVVEEIAQRWPITIELGIMALILGLLIALPIGIFSAVRQDSWGDHLARSFAIAAIAVPGFWIATLVMVFPAIWWGYMPPIMYVPFFEDPLTNLQMFIAPSFVLGLGMAGATMRLARTMMLEVLRQDYIRTAWSKGLRERVVVIRHALKNAIIPVITLIGLRVPILIGGSVVMERIFVLPGMGSLIFDSIGDRDYPLISGAVIFFGFGIVLINLLIDLTYAFLDPRVRYG